ncbi:MAG: hypothetical protein NTW12_15455 [Deltaproteobacteria bacterium]|nr:hypothetical protein [Deltaproteobacteria bacterium]
MTRQKEMQEHNEKEETQMNTKQRVIRMEEKLQVNQEPKTLEEMQQKLFSGGYGLIRPMSIVSYVASGGSWDHFKGKLPDLLIASIRETLEKTTGFNECRAKHLETA